MGSEKIKNNGCLLWKFHMTRGPHYKKQKQINIKHEKCLLKVPFNIKHANAI